MMKTDRDTASINAKRVILAGDEGDYEAVHIRNCLWNGDLATSKAYLEPSVEFYISKLGVAYAWIPPKYSGKPPSNP